MEDNIKTILELLEDLNDNHKVTAIYYILFNIDPIEIGKIRNISRQRVHQQINLIRKKKIHSDKINLIQKACCDNWLFFDNNLDV